MERGPGVRKIEKGDEEGYGGVAMNVCRGVQNIQHIFKMTPTRNHSNREGRRPTSSDLSHQICEIATHTAGSWLRVWTPGPPACYVPVEWTGHWTHSKLMVVSAFCVLLRHQHVALCIATDVVST